MRVAYLTYCQRLGLDCHSYRQAGLKRHWRTTMADFRPDRRLLVRRAMTMMSLEMTTTQAVADFPIEPDPQQIPKTRYRLAANWRLLAADSDLLPPPNRRSPRTGFDWRVALGCRRRARIRPSSRKTLARARSGSDCRSLVAESRTTERTAMYRRMGWVGSRHLCWKACTWFEPLD